MAASTGSAYAGVSVSVGGDSNWTVTATAKTSTNTPKYHKKMTGSTKIVYNAHFLGMPLPVTGHYVNSFPYGPFARPVLQSADAPLYSGTTYSRYYNSYVGSYAWEVRGKQKFWGDKTVHLSGKAKVDVKNVSGYFLAGTYPCGSKCTNADAIIRVKVKR